MSSRSIALVIGALLASQDANAACVISGARPTAPLPTMLRGQEFSFIASRDCETLRFTIRGTDLSKNPMSGGPVGPGPQTYEVVLTDSEWDAVVAEGGSTLTWVVTGRTSAGVTTRMVTTNELKVDETITLGLSMADAKLVGGEPYYYEGGNVSGAGDVDGDGHDDLLIGPSQYSLAANPVYLVLGPVTGTLEFVPGRRDAHVRKGGRSMGTPSRAPVMWTATAATTCWSARDETTKEAIPPVPPTWCRALSRGRWISPWPMPSSWAKKRTTLRAPALRTPATWMATVMTTC